MRKYTMCLCEGRHEMPSNVEGAIFPNEINPLDLRGMGEIVYSKLQDASELDLYVTGLTVALCEVIWYCVSNAVPLTLYHFDKASGTYYSQPLLVRDQTAQFDYNYQCVTGAPLPIDPNRSYDIWIDFRGDRGGSVAESRTPKKKMMNNR